MVPRTTIYYTRGGDRIVVEEYLWNFRYNHEAAERGLEFRDGCPYASVGECERCDAEPPVWGRCYFAPVPAAQGSLDL